jgi:pimeloyl-ACP methyl ester carboxylesterase
MRATQIRSRRGRVATLLAAVLVALVIAPSADADRKAKRCLKPQSWVAGTTSLCKGAVVYGDYVFDDHGADTGAPFTNRIGPLSPTAGDERYPAGEEGTADLVRLTLKLHPRRSRLRVTALLAALQRPDQTRVVLAVDTDANAETGGGRWGDLDVSSSGWDRLYELRTGEPDRNIVRGTIPMPTGKRWRVQAVTVTSAGEVMNVAFRGPDERSRFAERETTPGTAVGAWFEDLQAEALSAGDISQFGQTVKSRQVRRRKTKPAVVSSGYHERVYRSDYTIGAGEGYSLDGVPGRGDGGAGIQLGFEQSFNFLGRYQPYGIYIPKAPGPHGMQMVFHGSSANMASLIGKPGMQQHFGEDLNRILVTPEGRGTEGWASDISERDLLDVMADVKRSYEVDESKVFAGGYSQGGYATYRMASLHPDMFAGATDWVGFTGDAANGNPLGFSYTGGAVGNAIDFIPNLLNVPTVMLYAGADELVQFNQSFAIDAAFAATDNVYRHYFHPLADHFTFAALDEWRKEAAYTKGLELDPNPPRVLFRTAPFLDAPQYGIRHDSAYWVSRIRTTGEPTDYGTVDLTNAGCGGSLPRIESETGAGPDPVPWTSTEHAVVGADRLKREPRLTGSLERVSSLRIDARRTCLRGKKVSYDIASDGPARIRLSDGRTIELPAGGGSGTLRIG